MGKRKSLYTMSYEELLKECILLQHKNYLLERDNAQLKRDLDEVTLMRDALKKAEIARREANNVTE